MPRFVAVRRCRLSRWSRRNSSIPISFDAIHARHSNVGAQAPSATDRARTGWGDLVIQPGAAAAPGAAGKKGLNLRMLPEKFTDAIVVGASSMLATHGGGDWRRGPA